MNEGAAINYPIGIQTFREIRERGYLYVDKSAYILPLLQNGTFKFLSRPRRFGKSLLVSMLESFFKGERQLFKGLAIDRLLPEQWEKHPVVHLDLSGEDYADERVLERKLDMSLRLYESELGLEPGDETFSERLRIIIRMLHSRSGSRVAVLIDEYDNPITSAIGNSSLQERFREMLYGFYSSLKSLDSHIHFCLLTGVTKYGHMSVFSGLNNLMDISMLNEFSGICGITEEELHSYFVQGINELAEEEGISVDDCFNQLKVWYDGYHFSRSLLDVYNPFCVMNSLARREISDYWYQTGQPSILIRTLQDNSIDIRKLNEARASVDMLDNISAFNVNPIALFYQTGYLTIKGYDRTSRLFTLGFPNKEVEVGLLDNLLNTYAHISDSKILITDMRMALRAGRTEEFISILKSFFANIPYDLRRNIEKYENYYHSLFYVLLRLLGMDIDAEYHTSEGSIDILIRTADYIYVIELKVNGSASDAMNQINSRQYSLPFASDSRQIIKVGIGFCESTHTIDSYIVD